MINRPQPDECAPFFAKYINLVGKGPILEILDYLKNNTYNFFMRLAPDKADYAYAEGKWTIKEVLGHMIDAERTFAYRAFCFSRGQKELPGFDENEYVANATFKQRSIEDLANEFKAVRESNLYLFRSISEEQEIKTGISNGHPVSVRALIYMTAGHELHSLKVIKERYF